MPTSEPLDTGNALLGLAILTAIPVVMFALWADYYARYLDLLNEKEPKYDRAAELRRIRIAGVWSFLTQVITFLASSPVRHEHPVFSGSLFLAALVIQGQLQFGVEKKVRGLEAGTKDQLRFGLRSLFWGLAAGAGYLTTVCVSFYAFNLAGKLLGFSPGLLVGMSALGGAFGIFVGLGLIFALAPFQIRKLMPTEPLTDPETRKILEDCFARAQLPLPRLWIIEMDQFRWNNAMVAGFASGRGWFQPALFVTRSLLKNCSPDELRAIISHEVSHISLNHLRKRFILSFAVALGSAFLASLILVSAHLALPPAAAGAFGIPALFIQIGMPLLLIRRQMQRHEEEADLHAVTRLGADLGSLILALRKLDVLNDQVGDKSDPNTFAVLNGHPTTEQRIRLLQQKVPSPASAPGTRIAPAESKTDKAA